MTANPNSADDSPGASAPQSPPVPDPAAAAADEPGDAAKALKQLAAIMGHPTADGVPFVWMDADLNVTAGAIGAVVARLPLFRLNEELVCFSNDGERMTMSPRLFRTWINSHLIVTCRTVKETGQPIPGTLKEGDAAAILEAQSFLRGVRKIESINRVRLPVVRSNGALEKLPWGYDDETRVYTVPGGIDYATDVSLESAKVGLGRVDGEFPFSCPRSIAVQRGGEFGFVL